MRVKIECKNLECKQHLSCPEDLFGKTVKCPTCGTVNRVPNEKSETKLPYDRLGPYKLKRKIGQGAMGTVYEALDEKLGRQVALKVLLPRLTESEAFLARFQREAQAAANLNHPHIVTVYDVGEDRGKYFFSMEYVEGESLFDQLEREEKIPLADALDVTLKVAEALKYAWAHGQMIHRDIKPDNMLMSRDGHLKLADLGLAKSVKEQTGLTTTGEGFGSPAYMAPEQAKEARDVDCRADMYSLGISLYHMATGRAPFRGHSMLKVVLAHEQKPLPDPRKFNPDLPESLFVLLRKMCAKDPDDRYQNYEDLIEDLNALARGRPFKHAGLASADSEDREATLVEEEVPPRPKKQKAKPKEEREGDPEALEETVDAGQLIDTETRRRVATKARSRPAPAQVPPEEEPVPEPAPEPAPDPAAAPPARRSKAKVAIPVIAACLTIAVALLVVLSRNQPEKKEGTPPVTETKEAPETDDEKGDLEDIFQHVKDYAKSNPDNYRGIIDRFETVKVRGAGTVYEFKAQDEAELWRKKWTIAALGEFASRQKKAIDFALAGELDDARQVWQEFPEDLQPETVKERVHQEITSLTQLAMGPAPEDGTGPGDDAEKPDDREGEGEKGPEIGDPPAEDEPGDGGADDKPPPEEPGGEGAEGTASPGMPTGEDFDKQLQAFAEIDTSLGPLLEKHKYDQAVTISRFRATAPGNEPFRNDLLAMKPDFDAVEGLYGRFLAELGKVVGETVTLGAHRGKVLEVREDAVLLDENGKRVPVAPGDIAATIISHKLSLPDDAPAEQWYALGVLLAHEGYEAQAREALRKAGDGQPGVERQLRWLAWRREVEAKTALAQLKEAGDSGQTQKVLELAGSLLESYANTQVVSREGDSIRTMKETAEQALADTKKALEDSAAKLEEIVQACYAAANRDYDEKKKEIVKKYDEEVGPLRQNIEKIKAGLEKAANRDQEKKLKKDLKDAEKKFSAADRKYRELPSKLREFHRRTKTNIRSKQTRLARKIRGGEVMSEEEILKEFDLEEIPAAAEDEPEDEEDEPAKGEGKPEPADE